MAYNDRQPSQWPAPHNPAIRQSPLPASQFDAMRTGIMRPPSSGNPAQPFPMQSSQFFDASGSNSSPQQVQPGPPSRPMHMQNQQPHHRQYELLAMTHNQHNHNAPNPAAAAAAAAAHQQRIQQASMNPAMLAAGRTTGDMFAQRGPSPQPANVGLNMSPALPSQPQHPPPPQRQSLLGISQSMQPQHPRPQLPDGHEGAAQFREVQTKYFFLRNLSFHLQKEYDAARLNRQSNPADGTLELRERDIQRRMSEASHHFNQVVATMRQLAVKYKLPIPQPQSSEPANDVLGGGGGTWVGSQVPSQAHPQLPQGVGGAPQSQPLPGPSQRSPQPSPIGHPQAAPPSQPPHPSNSFPMNSSHMSPRPTPNSPNPNLPSSQFNPPRVPPFSSQQPLGGQPSHDQTIPPGSKPPLARDRFFSTYHTLSSQQGIVIDPSMLKIADRQIDLYQLHVEVMKEGGEPGISAKDLWPIIAGRIGFAQMPGMRSSPPVAHQLRTIYSQYLMLFDQLYMRSLNAPNSAGNMPSTHGPSPPQPPDPTQVAQPQQPHRPYTAAKQMAEIVANCHHPYQVLKTKFSPEVVEFIEKNRPLLMQKQQEQSAFHINLSPNPGFPSGRPASPRMSPQPPANANPGQGSLPSLAGVTQPGSSTQQQHPLQQPPQQQPQPPRPPSVPQTLHNEPVQIHRPPEQQQPPQINQLRPGGAPYVGPQHPNQNSTAGHPTAGLQPTQPRFDMLQVIAQLPSPSEVNDHTLMPVITRMNAMKQSMKAKLASLPSLEIGGPNEKMMYRRLVDRMLHIAIEFEPKMLFFALVWGRDNTRCERIATFITFARYQSQILSSGQQRYISPLPRLEQVCSEFQSNANMVAAAHSAWLARHKGGNGQHPIDQSNNSNNGAGPSAALNGSSTNQAPLPAPLPAPRPSQPQAHPAPPMPPQQQPPQPPQPPQQTQQSPRMQIANPPINLHPPPQPKRKPSTIQNASSPAAPPPTPPASVPSPLTQPPTPKSPKKPRRPTKSGPQPNISVASGSGTNAVEDAPTPPGGKKKRPREEEQNPAASGSGDVVQDLPSPPKRPKKEEVSPSQLSAPTTAPEVQSQPQGGMESVHQPAVPAGPSNPSGEIDQDRSHSIVPPPFESMTNIETEEEANRFLQEMAAQMLSTSSSGQEMDVLQTFDRLLKNYAPSSDWSRTSGVMGSSLAGGGGGSVGGGGGGATPDASGSGTTIPTSTLGGSGASVGGAIGNANGTVQDETLIEFFDWQSFVVDSAEDAAATVAVAGDAQQQQQSSSTPSSSSSSKIHPPTPELVPSSTNPSPESNAESESLTLTSHPMKFAPIEDDVSDPLRLGIFKEVDGGESAYFNTTTEWKWDGQMLSLDSPWAITT